MFTENTHIDPPLPPRVYLPSAGYFSRNRRFRKAQKRKRKRRGWKRPDADTDLKISGFWNTWFLIYNKLEYPPFNFSRLDREAKVSTRIITTVFCFRAPSNSPKSGDGGPASRRWGSLQRIQECTPSDGSAETRIRWTWLGNGGGRVSFEPRTWSSVEGEILRIFGKKRNSFIQFFEIVF